MEGNTAQVQQAESSEPKLVKDFREEYAEAFAQAVIQAEHTATDGWQRLVAGFRDGQKAGNKSLNETLKAIAKQVLDYGVMEPDEKAIGEAKKTANALRVSAECFDADVITPVRDVAQEPGKVIERFARTARQTEDNQPLLANGIVADMAAAIGEVAKVEWDDETAVVKIPDHRAFTREVVRAIGEEFDRNLAAITQPTVPALPENRARAVVSLAIADGKVTASSIYRKIGGGYPQAAKLLAGLIAVGAIGTDGAPLMTLDQWEAANAPAATA